MNENECHFRTYETCFQKTRREKRVSIRSLGILKTHQLTFVIHLRSFALLLVCWFHCPRKTKTYIWMAVYVFVYSDFSRVFLEIEIAVWEGLPQTSVMDGHTPLWFQAWHNREWTETTSRFGCLSLIFHQIRNSNTSCIEPIWNHGMNK